MILVNSIEIEQNHFSDGALHMSFALNSLSRGIVPINIKWYYENDSELFTIICLAKKFADHKKTLYMPYCPHARMDRVKNEEDTFTLKYFCEVINSLKFERVYVVDAHSSVALALLDNVINLSVETKINYAINNYLGAKKGADDVVVIFPDEGAMKRYSQYIKVPYTFGIKDRDWKTGKIIGYSLMDAKIVKDKYVLIVDDICSCGDTIYKAAKLAEEAGAKGVSAYATHIENTLFEAPLYPSDLITFFYTTQSICDFNKDELAKVINTDLYS
jgi:ribose-phosphate pyrophosphokinase